MSFSDAMSDPLLKFTAVASATLMAIGCVFMAVAELSAAPQETNRRRGWKKLLVTIHKRYLSMQVLLKVFGRFLFLFLSTVMR